MEEQHLPTSSELAEILARLGSPAISEDAIRAFTSEEDGRPYAVWLVDTGTAKCVLKRAKALELEAYRCFFRERKPSVPALQGSCSFRDEDYFLTEYCPGNDLRRCDRERLILALDALIALQDEFWQRTELYDSCVTLEKALEAIEIRGRYLGSELLERAYAKFVRVFRETPRTLVHDDLLPINLLVSDRRAVLIDWEYAGILPYPSSFARLIAHGLEEKDAFFRLSVEDRDYAIEYYYEKLLKKHGISYGAYRRTLDHFLFYEYCEWIMLGNRYDSREDERYGYYLGLAEEMAARLLSSPDPGPEG